MRLILYVCNAEENRLDKSPCLTEVFSLYGSLRSDSSVINPQILVRLPSIDMEDLAEAEGESVLGDGEELLAEAIEGCVPVFNYAYIPEFHRHYFITDIVSVKTNLYMISMRCDPLMSFKDSILNQTAIVERCEDAVYYDALLVDGERPLKNEKEIVFITPEKGPSVNVEFNPERLNRSDDLSFILNVIDNNWIGSQRALPSSPSGLPRTDGERQSCPSHSITLACSIADIYGIGYTLQEDDAKNSFVISCVSFPFKITEELGADISGGRGFISLGSEHLLSSAYWYKYGNIFPYLVAMDYTFPEISSFLEFGSYRVFEIYVPYYGYVEIPYQRVAGKRALLIYSVATSTGSGSAFLYCPETEEEIFRVSLSLGTRISFNTTNKRENDIQEQRVLLNAIFGSLTAGGQLALGMGTGDAKSVSKSLSGIPGLIIDTALGFQSIIPRAQTNPPDPVSGAMGKQSVFFRCTSTAPLFDLSSDAGAEYKRTRGVPCDKAVELSNLTGFARIGNIRLEGIPATDAEVSSILSLLSSGVIF